MDSMFSRCDRIIRQNCRLIASCNRSMARLDSTLAVSDECFEKRRPPMSPTLIYIQYCREFLSEFCTHSRTRYPKPKS